LPGIIKNTKTKTKTRDGGFGGVYNNVTNELFWIDGRIWSLETTTVRDGGRFRTTIITQQRNAGSKRSAKMEENDRIDGERDFLTIFFSSKITCIYILPFPLPLPLPHPHLARVAELKVVWSLKAK
jgi:hypothetical protein